MQEISVDWMAHNTGPDLSETLIWELLITTLTHPPSLSRGKRLLGRSSPQLHPSSGPSSGIGTGGRGIEESRGTWALLLAGPGWSDQGLSSGPGGWVLVSPPSQTCFVTVGKILALLSLRLLSEKWECELVLLGL